MDKRYNLYHTQRKVVKQWMTVLVIVIALTYISQPVQKPVSPSPCGGCILPSIPKVEAAEPIKHPQTIEEKIRSAFPEDPDIAVKVAFCESSLNPNAKHTNSSASGLFQIIKGTWNGYKCGDNRFDPDQNIACARKIYLRNGWGSTASWAASKPCWSK